MQARRTARGFARGRSRGHDFAFIEECEAEGYFVVTEMILTTLSAIMEKYPDLEERLKFYRMSVGYRLKGYWAHRATSTISFLKKKGISTKIYELYETNNKLSEDFRAIHSIARKDANLTLFELREDLFPNELDKHIVEFYAMGNPREMIATKCGITPKRVKRILRRIKRKLIRTTQ